MILKRINTTSDPLYREALKLYAISFPHHEQREKASQEEILKENEYHFSLIFDGDDFIGLILYWEQEEFIYVEHFCIFPEMRNRQYGQKALRLLEEQGKTIILEIDPPEDDISIRRRGFYERCGFKENGYPHIHPPYHQGNTGHSLVIMTFPDRISVDLFETFSHYLKHKVMSR